MEAPPRYCIERMVRSSEILCKEFLYDEENVTYRC